ncbi:MAG: carbon monoxide dehydrogenase subunit G [Pseudomonadota bacterium]
MKLAGTRHIAADRQAVWEKLNDPDVLKRCIPGCQSLEQLSPTELKATAGLKIGPMNAKFTGNVTLKDLNPPENYRIEGSGSGGVAGRASGGADVKLTAVEGGTELSYDVDAAVSGKIAQLGQRLIDATANQLADKFFDAFQSEFAPAPAAADDAAPIDATSSDQPIARSPSSGRSSQTPWLWYGASALALALVALLIVQSFS